jgi:hypothetical protein
MRPRPGLTLPDERLVQKPATPNSAGCRTAKSVRGGADLADERTLLFRSCHPRFRRVGVCARSRGFAGRLSNLLEYSTVMPYSARSRGLTEAIKLALDRRQGAESRRLRFTDGRSGTAPLDVCRPQQGSNPQIRPTKRSGALMAVHSKTPLKRADVFLAFESH